MGSNDKKKIEIIENHSYPTYKTGLLFVELLLKDLPQISIDKIKSNMKEECGDIGLLMNTSDMTAFNFKDYQVECKDKKLPALFLLITLDQKIEQDKLKQALEQTWGWDEKKNIIDKCRYKLVISDFLTMGLHNSIRVKLFNFALRAILMDVDCLALHWIRSQRLVDPQTFVTTLDEDDMLHGALNVRFYHIKETKK